MARTFSSRILNFLWGTEDGEYDERYDGVAEPLEEREFLPPVLEDEPVMRPAPRRPRPAPRQDDLVELRPPSRPTTEIHYPRSFDDAQHLADLFKQGAMLIIDLEQVDDKDRARLINFLCGVAYGRDGKSHKINELTFAFAPRHFDLEADEPRREARDSSYVPRFNVG